MKFYEHLHAVQIIYINISQSASYSHPSLLAGSYLMILQICGIAPRITIHCMDHEVDRRIKTIPTRSLTNIAWCSRCWGKKRNSFLPHSLYKEKKNRTIFCGGQSIFLKFLLFTGCLEPNPCRRLLKISGIVVFLCRILDDSLAVLTLLEWLKLKDIQQIWNWLKVWTQFRYFSKFLQHDYG